MGEKHSENCTTTPFSIGTALIAFLLLLGSVAAGDEPPAKAGVVTAPELEAADPPPPPLLTRLVRHFDFEEAERVPMAMPNHFHRNKHRSPFGDMTLTAAAAYTGRWSFGFTLERGPMAARVPTGVLPVMPGSDYRISVMVRSDELRHARALLAGWLYDASGNVIAGSTQTSRPTRTQGRWESLTVIIPGTSADAVSLGVELQLLQPGQYRGASLAPGAPVPADHAGRVWFDDLKIWHLPRIELTTPATGNVFIAPEPPIITVAVHDLVNNQLQPRLRVYDIDGNTVEQRLLERPVGPLSVELAALPYGWYRATVDLLENGQAVGHASTRFCHVPAPQPRPPLATAPFGITLTPRTPTDLAMTEVLGAECLVVTLPDQPRAGDDEGPDLERALDGLLDRGLDLIFALPSSSGQILDRWQDANPSLGDDRRSGILPVVMEFGHQVNRWQIGTSAPPLEANVDLSAVEAAAAALGRQVPALRPLIPIALAQTPPGAGSSVGFNLSIASDTPPHHLPELIAPWRGLGTDLVGSLAPGATDRQTPRRQLVGLTRRAFYARRAGLTQLVIPAPWGPAEGESGRVEPTVTFAVWRQLIDRLRGRHVIGELSTTADMQAWLIQGDGDGTAALVAWTDRVPSRGPATLNMLLAESEVVAIDVFGNSRLLPVLNNMHTVPVDSLPVFVEGIDANLARFRAGFQIDPDFVPTAHRLHEHTVLLKNPWPVPITGTMYIDGEEQWRITPRSHRFTIGPGETGRFPVTLIPDRRMTAGEQTIGAKFDLTADRVYRLRTTTTVRTGHATLQIEPRWQQRRDPSTGQDDLVVLVDVTNTGSRPVRLSAFLHAPGLIPRRQRMAPLEPGVTTTQSFLIENGADLLSKTTIFVGVEDPDDASRLIAEVEIP